MSGTGRIGSNLRPEASRLIFGPAAGDATAEELRFTTEVDLAHLVMLDRCRLLGGRDVRPLVMTIEDLRRIRFAPLTGLHAERGTFALYERHLIGQLGPGLGGVLQTGRSRNDLNATVHKLRLRTPYRRLVLQTLRLQRALLDRSGRYGSVVLPVSTHFQAAVPVTVGHYLAGIAAAIDRDVDWLLDAGEALDTCPLGAGAAGGTSFPIDAELTARLLGFDRPAHNSLDAVASRDAALRIAGAAACLAVTLSRLAADLLSWCGTGSRFFRLPDDLVGASSLMPQKRNPFLLEHVLGITARSPGVFAGMVTAMHAAPFTNSIAAGSEAVKLLPPTLDEMSVACRLARLVVLGIEPDAARMREVAVAECTTATELANRLVTARGISFREAHIEVGRTLTELEKEGPMRVEDAAHRLLPADSNLSAELDPESVVRATSFGGGPAPGPLTEHVRHLGRRVDAHRDRIRRQASRWRDGRRELRRAVDRLCHAGS